MSISLTSKLGSIYFTLGQYNEAIKEYKKGLKMLKENKEKLSVKLA
ncbi:tetratricopeptide repeat protein [Crocosphaera watsonii]